MPCCGALAGRARDQRHASQARELAHLVIWHLLAFPLGIGAAAAHARSSLPFLAPCCFSFCARKAACRASSPSSVLLLLRTLATKATRPQPRRKGNGLRSSRRAEKECLQVGVACVNRAGERGMVDGGVSKSVSASVHADRPLSHPPRSLTAHSLAALSVKAVHFLTAHKAVVGLDDADRVRGEAQGTDLTRTAQGSRAQQTQPAKMGKVSSLLFSAHHAWPHRPSLSGSARDADWQADAPL